MMNTDVRNPFRKIRTEQMGEFAWRYFVEPSKEYIGSRPLIFEASRGTGKTMFFKCNSWKEKLANFESKGLRIEEFLKSTKHLGFYYKADGRFLKGMEKRNVEEYVWQGIFNTYFNIIVAKEICYFIRELLSSELIKFEELARPISNICTRLRIPLASNLLELETAFDNIIITIELFCNNTASDVPPGLHAGTIIKDLIVALRKSEYLATNTFHVFVDEYEELLEYQQVELNTLLKQSDDSLVYDFGVITKGILTYKTSSGQEIRPKDDFLHWATDRFQYYEQSDYETLLVEICKKRLKEELEATKGTYDSKYLDIRNFLVRYGPKYEDQLFVQKSKELNGLKDRIRLEIDKQAKIFRFSDSESIYYFETLTDCSPTEMRVHLALLMRNKEYSKADVLVTHRTQRTDKYKDWLHNMSNAATYLLCDEFGVQKKYHGFDVFSALSTGVTRSFLELAEYAFDYAINCTKTPFTFDSPRGFTVDEQTKAVYFVSKLKVNEIDSYEPVGFRLKSFTVALGHIFHAIQTNPKTTLGDIEPNHFETKAHELKKYSQEASDLLKYAIRYKILEEDDPTKTKSEGNVEITDYHLNHIYCPTFGISHRRKQKIPISHLDLAKLFCGSPKEMSEVTRKLSDYKSEQLPNLFSQQNELPGEI